MGKASNHDDDELVERLRADREEIRPGRPLEENLPLDLENPPVDLDAKGVDNT